MLQKNQDKAYSILLGRLEDLQKEIEEAPSDWSKMQKCLNDLLIFWREMLHQEKDSVRILAEMNRTFRLLETDLLILQVSRSTQSYEQRLAIFQQRLEQGIGYCKLMLAQNE